MNRQKRNSQSLKGGVSVNEHSIQNSIRLRLSELGYYTERINVGSGYLIPKQLMDNIKRNVPESLRAQLDKIPYFNTGAVKGRSDLSAIKDGKITFIEVKTETGRPTPEQLNFIEQMQRLYGCRAGIARSPEEAIKLVTGAD